MKNEANLANANYFFLSRREVKKFFYFLAPKKKEHKVKSLITAFPRRRSRNCKHELSISQQKSELLVINVAHIETCNFRFINSSASSGGLEVSVETRIMLRHRVNYCAATYESVLTSDARQCK